MSAPTEQVRSGLQVRVPLEGLLTGQGKRVHSPWGELALFLLSNGEPRAILNRCPHRGGTLAEGILCGAHVFCTQHDWKICLDDGKAVAPDLGSTPVFKATIVGENVVIEPEG
jgi:nitrite reductase (NADH) small subunit